MGETAINDQTNLSVSHSGPVLHTVGYLLRNGGTDMEERIVVTGGRPLNGSVKIPAAKNSVWDLQGHFYTMDHLYFLTNRQVTLTV